MSTLNDAAEQWAFAAGTHWSQEADLTSGFHATGRQRTPGDYVGRHRRTDRILGRGEWAVVDLHGGFGRWWRTGDIERTLADTVTYRCANCGGVPKNAI